MKKLIKKDGLIFISFREGSFEGFTDKSRTGLFEDKKRFLSTYKMSEIKKLLSLLNYKVIETSKAKRKHGGEVFINVFAKYIK